MNLDQFRDVDLVIDKANDNFIQRQFVSQGDYKGRTLTVQITDRGIIGEVPGLTLNLRWNNTTSGLTDLSAFECIDPKNSLFKIEYPVNMLTPGKVLANIQVIQNGKVTHLKTFDLTVQKLAGKMVGVTEQAEYGALVTTLAKANEFETEIAKKADKAEVTARLAQKALQTDLDTTNTNVSNIQSQVNNLEDGSPKGTYATLTDLQTAYPTGTTGIYVVTADGKWYFWNGTAWTEGGVYQAPYSADFPIANGISNGDFSNGTTDWVNNSGTLSVANNTLSATSNGALGSRWLEQTTPIVAEDNKKVYFKHRVRVTNSDTQYLRLQLVGTTASGTTTKHDILSPVLNQWYDVETILTIPSDMEGNIKVRYIMAHADSATSNGKVMEIQYVAAIDITEAFGAGKEPTLPEMSEFIAQYPNNWFDGTVSYKSLKEVYQKVEVLEKITNNLDGAIVVGNGDSIMFGVGESTPKAWLGRIAEKYNCTVENRAVGGGTIATGTLASDGVTPRHWIVDDIVNMRSDATHVMLEGLTNDGAVNVPLGNISTNYAGNYDETNFTGALESCFYQIYNKYPNAKKGFIIVYKNPNHSTTDEAFVNRALEVCKKWSIDTYNLWERGNINGHITNIKNQYLPDGIHLNEDGYDFDFPSFEKWLLSI